MAMEAILVISSGPFEYFFLPHSKGLHMKFNTNWHNSISQDNGFS